MKIVGCDLHAKQQTIAMVDTETGEFTEKTLAHEAAVWVVDPWRWNRAHVTGMYGPAIAGWAETADYLLDLEEACDTDDNEDQTSKKWPIAIEPSHIDRRIAA